MFLLENWVLGKSISLSQSLNFRVDECIYFYNPNSIGNEEFLVVKN